MFYTAKSQAPPAPTAPPEPETSPEGEISERQGLKVLQFDGISVRFLSPRLRLFVNVCLLKNAVHC